MDKLIYCGLFTSLNAFEVNLKKVPNVMKSNHIEEFDPSYFTSLLSNPEIDANPMGNFDVFTSNIMFGE